MNFLSPLSLWLDDLGIIRALILRHLRTRNANNPFGVFVEFFRPIVICTVHYFYFSLLRRPVPGHQYAIFTLGGFTIWFTFAAAYSGTFEGAKWPAGATQIPGITPMHIRVAKVGWAFILYVFFAIVVIVPLQLYGLNVSLPDIGLTVADYGLAAALGFGYGLICNSIGYMLPATIPFIKITEWAVFISSGIYDSLVTLPSLMAKIVQYNPLIDLAEYQRHAYYPGYPVYLVSLSYPAIWSVGLILAGLLMNRALCNKKFR